VTRERWGAAVRRAPFVALGGALVWLYADVVRGLVTQWVTSPDASYGALVAAVGVLLIWERRRRIVSRADGRGALAGVAWLCGGLLVYAVGQLAADVFTTRASLVLVLGGCLAFLFGWRSARLAAAPLGFLLLSLPLPELVVATLTSSLQGLASRLAEVILVTGGIPVYRDGNVLELPSATLQVIEACSGMRSVVSLGSVGLLLAWAADTGWLRRVALVLGTVPIAVLVNAVRLALAGAGAERWGDVATRDPWHSLLGWMTFVVSLLLLWGVRSVLRTRRSGGPRLAMAGGA